MNYFFQLNNPIRPTSSIDRFPINNGPHSKTRLISNTNRLSIDSCPYKKLGLEMMQMKLKAEFHTWMQDKFQEAPTRLNQTEHMHPWIRVNDHLIEMSFEGFTWQFFACNGGFRWQGSHLLSSHTSNLRSNLKFFDVFSSFPDCEIEVIGPKMMHSVKFPTALGTHRLQHHLVGNFIVHLLGMEEDLLGLLFKQRSGNQNTYKAALGDLGPTFMIVRENLNAGRSFSQLLDSLNEFSMQLVKRTKVLRLFEKNAIASISKNSFDFHQKKYRQSIGLSGFD
jgi:hypothetical protein